jgi:hypothetical protein
MRSSRFGVDGGEDGVTLIGGIFLWDFGWMWRGYGQVSECIINQKNTKKKKKNRA